MKMLILLKLKNTTENIDFLTQKLHLRYRLIDLLQQLIQRRQRPVSAWI